MAATLTGSEQAGIAVGVGAAKRIKKVVLELGGSDPFIAMPSANLEAATSTAVKARIFHNGQSCIAAKRFIVAESIADEFEQLFAKKMAALKVGDPFDASTELGPLSTPEGVHDLDRGGRKTVEAGAKILTGGKPLDRPGNFYVPTVLVNIPKDSPAYQEELFGPVASVFRAKDIAVAIQIANDSRFGLGASAWSNDVANRRNMSRTPLGNGVHQPHGGLRPAEAVWRRELVRARKGAGSPWNQGVYEHQDGVDGGRGNNNKMLHERRGWW